MKILASRAGSLILRESGVDDEGPSLVSQRLRGKSQVAPPEYGRGLGAVLSQGGAEPKRLAERSQQLAERSQQLAERSQQLAERSQQLAERSQQSNCGNTKRKAEVRRSRRTGSDPPGNSGERSASVDRASSYAATRHTDSRRASSARSRATGNCRSVLRCRSRRAASTDPQAPITAKGGDDAFAISAASTRAG